MYEDNGSLVVQGSYEVGGGIGETRVRIPVIVLMEAAKALTEAALTEPMRVVPEAPEPRLWGNAETQPAAQVDWFRKAG